MKLTDHRATTDAAVNLALEEYCVRHLNNEENYLHFYINQPAVIIGAHQNPWEEVNHQIIHRGKIPVFRRVSGGGAVYHDSGNLNIAYITKYHKGTMGRFDMYMRPIIEVLSHLGLSNVNPRGNGIFIGNMKISGFAQFGNLKRTLTHGTLLYNSDLLTLNQALNHELEIVKTKAVASVRKEVTNLKPYFKVPTTIEVLKQLLTDSIASQFTNLKPLDLSSEAWPQIHSLAKTKYRSWEWTYGRTPFFSVKERIKGCDSKHSLLIEVIHGLVNTIDHYTDGKRTIFNGGLSSEWLQLKNQRYYPGIVRDVFSL